MADNNSTVPDSGRPQDRGVRKKSPSEACERCDVARAAGVQIEALCDSLRVMLTEMDATHGPGVAVLALVNRSRELGQAVIRALDDVDDPVEDIRALVMAGLENRT